MHATIPQKYIVFFHLIFQPAWPFDQKLGSPLIFFMCTRPFDRNIQSSFIYSFFWARPIQPKIKVHTDLFLFFCTRPFDKTAWSSFIYSFFCARPFHKNIWSSFIYSFFCARPLDQKLRSILIYFFICTRPFDVKLGSSLIYLFYFYTTIRPKIRVLIDLFFLFTHDHST